MDPRQSLQLRDDTSGTDEFVKLISDPFRNSVSFLLTLPNKSHPKCLLTVRKSSIPVLSGLRSALRLDFLSSSLCSSPFFALATRSSMRQRSSMQTQNMHRLQWAEVSSHGSSLSFELENHNSSKPSAWMRHCFCALLRCVGTY